MSWLATGAGKTQIATFIAYSRICKGHDSAFTAAPGTWCGFALATTRDAIKSLQAFQRVPFLCIDEAHQLTRSTFTFLSR